MKFGRTKLITYSANAPRLEVARWEDVRALRPPDGEVGWLEVKGQYECETEGRYYADTWALMTPGPNRRAALIHENGFL
jgi:hypothetical protein